MLHVSTWVSMTAWERKMIAFWTYVSGITCKNRSKLKGLLPDPFPIKSMRERRWVSIKELTTAISDYVQGLDLLNDSRLAFTLHTLFIFLGFRLTTHTPIGLNWNGNNPPWLRNVSTYWSGILAAQHGKSGKRWWKPLYSWDCKGHT